MLRDKDFIVENAIRQVEKHFNTEIIRFKPVDKNSNFNHVFEFNIDRSSFFLKVLLSSPKTMTDALPIERIHGELRGLTTFSEANYKNDVCHSPEIVHYEVESSFIVLSGVNGQRYNLADVNSREDTLFNRSISELAGAVARWHSYTALDESCRDFGYEEDLRCFIYQHLIAPGIRKICNDSADEILHSMQTNRECLIHSDLWAKNIYVSSVKPSALIDFEGCIPGDPAFDLATLVAMSLFPYCIYRRDLSEWSLLLEAMCSQYFQSLGSRDLQGRVEARLPGYLAVFIASRLEGPFRYDVPRKIKNQLSDLCRQIVGDQLTTVHSIAEYLNDAFKKIPLAAPL